MTPEQKIKHIILARIADWAETPIEVEVTADNIDDLYDECEDKWDAIYEVREGEVETKLPCQSSRHYESKSVAAKAPDGSWVGWTYWYGGGKHGEPEAIDWMDEAYNLDVTEEEKMVVVRTFKKAA
ncbi:hypothetical protein BZM27_05835 [Paraburkholderia steynii]|uniref:Uncharacterized protein n=1 Tax=Paraburkholderia steynii TaxID=1245441 RepID=A0A4R0XRK3_9BURK|nr:hypothetical protein BZM27_05835 [Paraburkholderia steynii]